MGPLMRPHARTGGPRAAVRRHPARGVGAAHRATAHHDPHRGSRPLVGCSSSRMATDGPGASLGVAWGRVLSPPSSPPPPRVVLHTANVLRATEIHTWGRDVATVWWLPPEGGAARLTVAHFKNGWPVYDNALSHLGDVPGPLLVMLPIDLAAALRPEPDSCEGLRVQWEAGASGAL